MTAEYESIRLDSLIRQRGAASRKEVRHLIESHRVQVNGIPAEDASMRCAPDAVVTIDGRTIPVCAPVTYMLNKPAGYVSVSDHPLYPSVLSLIREPEAGSLFCIGRLDADTEGLLLITNDGGLCEKIARPEQSIAKTYLVGLDRPLPEHAEELLASGVVFDDGSRCRPASVQRLDDRTVTITVTEGKYHEVKRLIRACGPIVASLRRISIGNLDLDPLLAAGEYKRLTENDLNRVFEGPKDPVFLADTADTCYNR